LRITHDVVRIVLGPVNQLTNRPIFLVRCKTLTSKARYGHSR
jgi:hypothetical protein